MSDVRKHGTRMAIYQQAYGDEQAIADLVPHMLAAFLASDRGFAKAREGLAERRK